MRVGPAHGGMRHFLKCAIVTDIVVTNGFSLSWRGPTLFWSRGMRLVARSLTTTRPKERGTPPRRQESTNHQYISVTCLPTYLLACLITKRSALVRIRPNALTNAHLLYKAVLLLWIWQCVLCSQASGRNKVVPEKDI